MFGFKRKDVFDVIFRGGAAAAREAFQPAPAAALAPEVEVEDTSARATTDAPRIPVSAMASAAGAWRYAIDDGEKFPGGFGPTLLTVPDYWTLRQRSSQLFETNIYGRGVIRRLITNEINTGLHLEATPEEAVLGKEEGALSDWSETTETRFELWAKDPYLCDFYERSTFGALQAQARMEALIAGDVLVVMRQDRRTRMPRIQLISGNDVQTPTINQAQSGNKICHGVELDPTGKHVAYWVRQDDGSIKRLPAVGEKSGRRIAWLVYGTDKRLDDVRGKPLLSLVLQSLKEIDRYRDSTQRKASILSMLVAFIKREEAKSSGRGFTAGASRKDALQGFVDNEGQPRTFKAQQYHPGVVLEQLEQGEEPQAFQVNGTTETFADFEEAIICAVAWTLEIPPEILRLSFSSNYSASQAAVNEFKQYLNKVRQDFGENFCEPIYQEWLISQVFDSRIDAPGLLEAWSDYWNKYDIVGAWLLSDWTGHVKPAVDLVKLVGGYEQMAENGFIDRDTAARELTGKKHSKIVRKLLRENVALAEAMKPLAELKALEKPKPPPPPDGGPPLDDKPARPSKKESTADVVAEG